MATLHWIGKEAVVNHHREVPYRLLKADPKLSVGPDGGVGSGNLLVQGDNLEALKALLPYYGGKVKCIYIDPPYNTGNEEWIYNDNVNSPEIRKWIADVVGPAAAKVGKEGDDLSRHDKWLCMMYPRLTLLRQFLTEDGAVFVSIDDNEVHNLRGLMDEVFGRRNFVASIIWQKRTSPDMRLQLSGAHEYVVCYARGIDSLRLKRLPKSEKQRAVFKNPDNDPRGPWVSSDFTAQGFRPNQMYKIKTPGGAEYEPPSGVCWKNVEPVFLELVKDNRIWFGKDGNGMPRRKTFLAESEGNAAWTWWPNDEVGHSQEAKQEVDGLIGDDAFDTPKPVRLLSRIIQLGADADSIIMDSFAGSGTTGHAVLAMNKADGGNRRFILIEMNKTIANDITAQRLTKVIEGYHPGGDKKNKRVEGVGGGFQYVTLGPTLFDEFGRFRTGEDKVTFAQLAAHIYFTQTGEPQPKATSGRKSPHIGTFRGTAYYLLYNGILGDKTPDGGNVLTRDVLAGLPKNPSPSGDGEGPKVVFGEACRLSEATLRKHGVDFRQIPYQVEVG